jgi:hypothetical protein
MAEIEFHVLNGQCLNRHMATKEKITSEVEAWQNHRNKQNLKNQLAVHKCPSTDNIQITRETYW